MENPLITRKKRAAMRRAEEELKAKTELENITGYLKTQWDCPQCDSANEEEGDATSDTVECIDCHTKFKISSVR